MQTIIQRVSQASVTVNGETIGEIGPGLVALAAVAVGDDECDVEWTAAKLVNLRIFRNGEKDFDLDVQQAEGAILLVSNFTVATDARKGRRPSFDGAAPQEVASGLFQKLVDAVRAAGVKVETGRFAADMMVSLVNDGPATFILDSCQSVQPRTSNYGKP